MNQTKYAEVLRRYMLPTARTLFDGRSFIFQQDNAPCHKAKSVKNIFAEIAATDNFLVIDWPPYSPDLSPIENLWAILDRKMKNRQVSSKIQLFQLIQRTWREIGNDKKLLAKLALSLKKRCKLCIEQKGHPINY